MEDQPFDWLRLVFSACHMINLRVEAEKYYLQLNGFMLLEQGRINTLECCLRGIVFRYFIQIHITAIRLDSKGRVSRCNHPKNILRLTKPEFVNFKETHLIRPYRLSLPEIVLLSNVSNITRNILKKDRRHNP